MKSKDNKAFYETVWFCVLMLFVFAPIGIFLLWKYKHFSTRLNVLFSVMSSLFFITLLVVPPEVDNSDNDTSQYTTSVSDIPVQDTSKPLPSASSYEYDALQHLYLDLDPNMSYSDMLDLVRSTELPYSEEKYNGSRKVQVAFTKGCTVQRHKKESGDYLEIIYEYPDSENNADDVLDKYAFGTCAYVPSGSDLCLICHVSGSYFSYSEPGNYISKLGNALNLDNGMSKKEQLDYYFNNK